MTTDQRVEPRLRLAMFTQANSVRVELSGDLDLVSVALFHRSLDPLLAVDPEYVEIDLRGLDFLDCAGATALVRVAEHLVRHDGTIIVRNASGGVERLLERCGFGSIAGVDLR